MRVDDPRLARLWKLAHRRMERAGGRSEEITVVIAGISDDERVAVDRLLGRRTRGRDLSVRLADVDAALRRLGSSLTAAVETTVGPVRDLLGTRAAEAAAVQGMWSVLAQHAALARHPDLVGWLGAERSTGQWRRLDDPALRLRQALDVVAALPATRPVGRSRLASDVLGPAHALDDKAAAGRLVLRALGHLDGAHHARNAAGRRALWASFGVEADETSSTVLTLGLRPLPAGPLTESAARWADSKVPMVLPLAAIDAEEWQVSEGETVWACENPSVVAAAAQLGCSMVCVEGQLSVAGERLLRSLIEHGARVRYHGDFGHGGILIANTVIGGLGAEPWRMCTDDHAQALAFARRGGADLPKLRGSVPDAAWDPGLAPAIRASGVEVEEEGIIDLLLPDLSG